MYDSIVSCFDESGTRNQDGVSETISRGQPTASALHFKRFKGFKIHRDRLTTPMLAGHHLKIQSDISGKLHIAKKRYKAPQTNLKDKLNSGLLTSEYTQAQAGPPYFSSQDIPTCIDSFPTGVDFPVLDSLADGGQRSQTTSVSAVILPMVVLLFR